MASSRSLATILGRLDLDDHPQILQAASAAIDKSNHSIDACHIKAVALLKLERYSEAVEFFDDIGDDLKQRARFEYAYALYKSGQAAAAVETAKPGPRNRALSHVLAQAVSRVLDALERAADDVARHTGSRTTRWPRTCTRSSPRAVRRRTTRSMTSPSMWVPSRRSGHGPTTAARRRAGLSRARTWMRSRWLSTAPARPSLVATWRMEKRICAKQRVRLRSSARKYLHADPNWKRTELCLALPDLSESEKNAEIVAMTAQQICVLLQQGKLESAKQLCSTLPSTEWVHPPQGVLD